MARQRRVVILVLGLAEPATAPVRRKDRAALFWLYENLGGAHWTRNVGWAADGEPCFMNARWVGVGCLDPCDTWRDGPECTAGRVTAVYLGDNNLTGGLGNWSGPAVLTNLSLLDLSFNRVSGTLPTQLGQVSNLQSLQLQSNLLSGNLPSQLGEINGAGALPVWSYGPTMQRITSRLENVQLHDNRLSGAVPTELGAHTALAQLYLHRNNLSGWLPSQLGHLGSLGTFYVQHNNLSGMLTAARMTTATLTTATLTTATLTTAILTTAVLPACLPAACLLYTCVPATIAACLHPSVCLDTPSCPRRHDPRSSGPHGGGAPFLGQLSQPSLRHSPPRTRQAAAARLPR